MSNNAIVVPGFRPLQGDEQWQKKFDVTRLPLNYRPLLLGELVVYGDYYVTDESAVGAEYSTALSVEVNSVVNGDRLLKITTRPLPQPPQPPMVDLLESFGKKLERLVNIPGPTPKTITHFGVTYFATPDIPDYKGPHEIEPDELVTILLRANLKDTMQDEREVYTRKKKLWRWSRIGDSSDIVGWKYP